MATLRRYAREDGCYVQINYHYRSQTLQVSGDAEDLFERLSYSADNTKLPLTLVKALVLTEDLYTLKEGPSKEDLLEKLPELPAEKCRLAGNQHEILQGFLQAQVKNLDKQAYQELNEFLINETPLEMVTWAESQSENGTTENLDSIASNYF